MYVRERRDLDVDGRKIWVVLSRSAPETACPEKSGVVRVRDYRQSVALESDGAQGTRGDPASFDLPAFPTSKTELARERSNVFL